MVTVELVENILTEYGHGEWRTVASIVVANGEHEIRDPDGVLDLERTALSVSNPGRLLAFADDPEEWARSLPSVYHAADLHAIVIKDDNPPVIADVERREIVLPDALRPRTNQVHA